MGGMGGSLQSSNTGLLLDYREPKADAGSYALPLDLGTPVDPIYFAAHGVLGDCERRREAAGRPSLVASLGVAANNFRPIYT